jgi:dihydropteroate synthase
VAKKAWHIKNHKMPIGERTLIMGILNVTPDSFSDGGLFVTVDAALAQAEKMISEGADIIDVGGESTRPGGEPISAEEEISRVVPVIETLSKRVDTPVSVDTTKSEVARAALDAGAAIVNDVSALRFDFYVADAAARAGGGQLGDANAG